MIGGTGVAIRPVFAPKKGELAGVFEKNVEFKWFPGMSATQKKRSIDSLHTELRYQGYDRVLEISSKSSEELGVSLSAFNLTFTTKKHKKSFTVESAFQGSKVFTKGGPFRDLFNLSPLDAKRDIRLKESGDLIKFEFFGETFSNKPRTLFYDWLYINALRQHKHLSSKLMDYDGFTDIEFNPKRSINCQAHAVALFVSLQSCGLIETAMKSQSSFASILADHYAGQSRNIGVQNQLV